MRCLCWIHPSLVRADIRFCAQPRLPAAHHFVRMSRTQRCSWVNVTPRWTCLCEPEQSGCTVQCDNRCVDTRLWGENHYKENRIENTKLHNHDPNVKQTNTNFDFHVQRCNAQISDNHSNPPIRFQYPSFLNTFLRHTRNTPSPNTHLLQQISIVKNKYIFTPRASHSHRKPAIHSNQRPLTGSIWWNRITTTPIRMAIWPPCTWAQSLTIRVSNCFSPPYHASMTPEWFQSVSNSLSPFSRANIYKYKYIYMCFYVVLGDCRRITQLMSLRRIYERVAWEFSCRYVIVYVSVCVCSDWLNNNKSGNWATRAMIGNWLGLIYEIKIPNWETV